MDAPGPTWARGLCLRDGAQCLIQISPALDPGQRFRTFLHETAHAKLHYDGLADLRSLAHVPEVQAAHGKRAAPDWLMESRKRAADQRELEAIGQSETWAARVADRATIRDKLQALINL